MGSKIQRAKYRVDFRISNGRMKIDQTKLKLQRHRLAKGKTRRSAIGRLIAGQVIASTGTDT
jgi:hypothetical protein